MGLYVCMKHLMGTATRGFHSLTMLNKLLGWIVLSKLLKPSHPLGNPGGGDFSPFGKHLSKLHSGYILKIWINFCHSNILVLHKTFIHSLNWLNHNNRKCLLVALCIKPESLYACWFLKI